jgi:hypothetical protein
MLDLGIWNLDGEATGVPDASCCTAFSILDCRRDHRL